MKDYAKVIHQSHESHGQKTVKESLTKSAVHHKSNREDSVQKKGGSGFFSVVALFILVAILFAVYRQYVRHKELANPAASAAATGQTPQAASNPQFDFYTVLPAGSTPGANTSNATTAAAATTPATDTAGTVIPPAPAAATATTTAPAQTINTDSAPTGQYYLNAGQFSNTADAQQMLSQLLLLGVQANIKTIQDNGSASYQVLVGPYDDQDAMNIVKQQLAAHQIQAAVLQQ